MFGLLFIQRFMSRFHNCHVTLKYQSWDEAQQTFSLWCCIWTGKHHFLQKGPTAELVGPNRVMNIFMKHTLPGVQPWIATSAIASSVCCYSELLRWRLRPPLSLPGPPASVPFQTNLKWDVHSKRPAASCQSKVPIWSLAKKSVPRSPDDLEGRLSTFSPVSHPTFRRASMTHSQ